MLSLNSKNCRLFESLNSNKYFRENQDDLKQREYHLFFVPTRSLLCEKRLEVSSYYLV